MAPAPDSAAGAPGGVRTSDPPSRSGGKRPSRSNHEPEPPRIFRRCTAAAGLTGDVRREVELLVPAAVDGAVDKARGFVHVLRTGSEGPGERISRPLGQSVPPGSLGLCLSPVTPFAAGWSAGKGRFQAPRWRFLVSGCKATVPPTRFADGKFPSGRFPVISFPRRRITGLTEGRGCRFTTGVYQPCFGPLLPRERENCCSKPACGCGDGANPRPGAAPLGPVVLRCSRHQRGDRESTRHLTGLPAAGGVCGNTRGLKRFCRCRGPTASRQQAGRAAPYRPLPRGGGAGTTGFRCRAERSALGRREGQRGCGRAIGEPRGQEGRFEKIFNRETPRDRPQRDGVRGKEER